MEVEFSRNELTTLLHQAIIVGNGVQKLVSVSALVNSSNVKYFFEILSMEPPTNVALIEVTPDLSNYYDHYFDYPLNSIRVVANIAVMLNNAGLLRVLTKKYALPEKYQLREVAWILSSEAAVIELKGRLSSFLSDTRPVINVMIFEPPYELLLKHGIIPHPEMSSVNQLLVFYSKNINRGETNYWLGCDYSELKKVRLWSFFNLGFLEEYRNSAKGYPFLFTYPSELYRSKRPKTNMSLFRLPSSKTYSSKSDLYLKEGTSYLPVTRYAKTMSGGLYYGKTRPEDICGRFYYYEEESTTLLSYRTGHIIYGINKTDIYHQLYERVKIIDAKLAEEMHSTYIGIIHSRKKRLVELQISKALNKTLEYSTYDAYVRFDLNSSKGNLIPKKSDTLFYVGVHIGLYAAEDKLDQPICTAGALLGYDIIFLQSMAGSHQAVSEVLDTRPDSFSHLVFRQ
jgi:hypothetical protein